MKATELRIGNYVYHHCSTIVEVIDSHKIEIESINHGFFEPIPLTEEWLLKFGFILEKDLVLLREDEKEYQVYIKNISIIDIKGSYYFWIGIEEDNWYSFEWTKIEYVHQLQNLNFAITGEEL